MKQSTDVLRKIEIIEEEIFDLKLSLLRKLTPAKKNLLSLKGILEGIDISEEDIEEAQKSLYSKTGI
ncbi:MAG: hypothetical protein IT393_06875 [Nitrospirae bacterium]|nr:hypothetical protein [Nitrospirota bacterium]